MAQDLVVRKAHREVRVTQVVRVCLETRVQLDLRVPKDRKVPPDQWDNKDRKASLAIRVQLDHRVKDAVVFTET